MISGNTCNEAAAGHAHAALVLRGQLLPEYLRTLRDRRPGQSNACEPRTAWEVAIKVSLGKLTLAVAYQDLFPGTLVTNGFEVLPADFRHCSQLLVLPFHHQDPFDRLLVAQALTEGMTLVSSDPHFPAYGVSVLW